MLLMKLVTHICMNYKDIVTTESRSTSMNAKLNVSEMQGH